MSTQLKSLVERIIHDHAFRNAFLAKPDAVLDDQPVSASERRALVRARRRLLLAGRGGGVALTQIEWP